MPSQVMSLYLGGLPNQDPVYRSVRKAIYGVDSPWLSMNGGSSVGELSLHRVKRSWKGLKLKGLETACGWESRAWDSVNPLSSSDAQNLLLSMSGQPGWDLCQLHVLMPQE